MTSEDIPRHGQDGFFYHTLPVVPRAQSALETLIDGEVRLLWKELASLEREFPEVKFLEAQAWTVQ